MVLGACSGGSVSRSDLAARVASELFEALGVHPDVSCEGDLPGEVDATTSCTAVDPDGGDVWYRITAAG